MAKPQWRKITDEEFDELIASKPLPKGCGKNGCNMLRYCERCGRSAKFVNSARLRVLLRK